MSLGLATHVIEDIIISSLLVVTQLLNTKAKSSQNRVTIMNMHVNSFMSNICTLLNVLLDM
jgi:hypothetical protein